MCICIRQYHQILGLHLWAVFRRRNVVMGIDVRWVSRGRRDVVSYHKSHNFFDFGVTCSTFISLCPNIRNTGLYFYLAFQAQFTGTLFLPNLSILSVPDTRHRLIYRKVSFDIYVFFFACLISWLNFLDIFNHHCG